MTDGLPPGADENRLADLLPHRPPMVLIDEVVSYAGDEQKLTAAVTVKPGWCENWTAIEFMAQTAAALVGRIDREEHPGETPRPGFLLGSRRLELRLERFAVGARYLVTAQAVFSDGAAASFACEILSPAGECVARATLNAFRPDSLADFLATQTGTENGDEENGTENEK